MRLRKAFIPTTLTFVPNENHISEIVNVYKDDDVTALAILQMIHPAASEKSN